jgi:hypothetical protein
MWQFSINATVIPHEIMIRRDFEEHIIKNTADFISALYFDTYSTNCGKVLEKEHL